MSHDRMVKLSKFCGGDSLESRWQFWAVGSLVVERRANQTADLRLKHISKYLAVRADRYRLAYAWTEFNKVFQARHA